MKCVSSAGRTGPVNSSRTCKSTRHQQVKAAELAEEIRKLREEDAERPIYLIGHSAGTGVDLRAARVAARGECRTIDPAVVGRVAAV